MHTYLAKASILTEVYFSFSQATDAVHLGSLSSPLSPLLYTATTLKTTGAGGSKRGRACSVRSSTEAL